MDELRVGMAQVDCTPPLGLPLQGNYRDDYGARGVHDPLMSKALVFESGGRKVALCMVDVCVLNAANADLFRRQASEATGIRPGDIMVAATHTHSGPALSDIGIMPSSSESEVRAFIQKAAGAVVAADQNLAPARLSIGKSREERVSFNRRLLCKDGVTHMNWEGLDPDFVVKAQGLTDPELQTMTVEQNGKSTGAIVNFGLHPAVLAGDNWLYSADYPGYLAESLRRIHGDRFVSVFANAPCGNVNSVDYSDLLQGRGFQMTQRIGYMLGAAATEAMRDQEPVNGTELTARSTKVELERLDVSDEEYASAKRLLENSDLKNVPGLKDGLPPEFYADMLVSIREAPGPTYKAEVMCLRIGDVALVGLPSEIFCELGMNLKRRSPAPRTLVIELANDYFGYMPTRESYPQGGYEALPGSTYFVPGSGEKLVDAAVRELGQMF